MEDHINLQNPKTSKIFGVIKTGANRTDQNVIKAMQGQGYNEHEIQRETGVNHVVIRSFMKKNNEDFMPTDAPITEENRHYIERIADLENKLVAADPVDPELTDPELTDPE